MARPRIYDKPPEPVLVRIERDHLAVIEEAAKATNAVSRNVYIVEAAYAQAQIDAAAGRKKKRATITQKDILRA